MKVRRSARRLRLYGCAFIAASAAAQMSGAAEYLVTDQASGRVVAIDAESGAYTRTLVSGLMQPSAIAWGPDSSVYVADLIAGAVLKVNPATGANSVFISGVDKPGSLHFDEAAGVLYVGEFGDFQTFQLGDEVFSYTTEGVLIPERTINAGPTGHAGLETDAEGNLYVSGFATDQFASGHVLKYSAPSGPNPLSPLGVFAPSPAPSPLLQGAAGLAFDEAGNLFVAGLISNLNMGGLVKFTVTDGMVTGEEMFDANIAFPSGVTRLPDGSILVTSLGSGTSPGTLYKYDPDTGARTQVVSPAFSGNFNGDAAVDGADLEAWKFEFGGAAEGDADGDGDSDGADFLAWQRGLGGPVAFSPSGAVYYDPLLDAARVIPEPTAWGLITVGLVMATTCRRIRARGGFRF